MTSDASVDKIKPGGHETKQEKHFSIKTFISGGIMIFFNGN